MFSRRQQCYSKMIWTSHLAIPSSHTVSHTISKASDLKFLNLTQPNLISGKSEKSLDFQIPRISSYRNYEKVGQNWKSVQNWVLLSLALVEVHQFFDHFLSPSSSLVVPSQVIKDFFFFLCVVCQKKSQQIPKWRNSNM